MAFTVETGAGLADANAFITVAFYRAYCAERMRTIAVSVTDQQIEQHLVRVADYIEQRFSHRFQGLITVETQALSMPRTGMVVNGYQVDENTVPLRFQQACAEYAWRSFKYDELAPDPPKPFDVLDASLGTVSAGGQITEISTEADVIKEKIKYAPPAFAASGGIGPVAGSAQYPAADMLMRPFLLPSGGTIRA